MKKKVLTTLLAVVIMLTSLTNTVFGDNTCGDGVTWQLLYGYSLQIEYASSETKTGAMTNFESADERPWMDNIADITTVCVNSGVTSIGNFAFQNFDNLTYVSIAEGVTSFGEESFGYCDKLATVKIPSTVTDISNAFAGCEALSQITIPTGVSNIKSNAFYRCFNLSSITFRAANPPTLANDSVFDPCHSDLKIYVPVKSLNAYKTATGWSKYADIIEASPLTIADLLPDDFPTTKAAGWANCGGNGSSMYKNGETICITNSSNDTQNLNIYNTVSKVSDNLYHCSDEFSYDFYVDDNNEIYKIDVGGYGLLSNITGVYEGPRTVSDILNTVENFPVCVDVLPLNTWVNDNGINLMLISNTLGLITNDGNTDKVLVNDITSTVLTKSGDNYTYTNGDVVTTFTMLNEKLINVIVSGITEYNVFNGTYITAIKIGTILPLDFPTTQLTAWVDQNGAKMYVDNFELISNATTSIYNVVTADGDNYKYDIPPANTIVFVMDSGTLQRIDVQGLFNTNSYEPYRYTNSPISKPAGYTGDITFVTNATYTDPADSNVSVKIDGVLLNNANYTVAHGSTKVTLKSDYVKTLTVGTHTITVCVNGYKDIDQEFEITPAPTPRYEVPNTGVKEAY